MHEPTSTILVVDDDPTLLETLAYNLQREGYRVLIAQDGPTAVRLAYSARPDLLLLDLMLPGLTGFEVCRAVRRELLIPILILSARADEADRVQGLDLGADGYLTKPFSLRELLARVRALLRRVEMGEPAPGQPIHGGSSWERPGNDPHPAQRTQSPSPVIYSGELTIDLAGHVVLRQGQPVALKPKEFDLLTFLALHPGQTFTREVLLDRLWGYDFVGGARTVDVHVRWLRSKLEQDAADPQMIQTIYGVGYKFVPPGTAPTR